jgi:hypothetical protein
MRYISQNLENNLKSPLAVVAHDAGAANLIAGWLKGIVAKDIRLSAAGPALAIFACELPHLMNMTLNDALYGANTLLSGTSGPATNMEHDARAVARERGIHSIGVIDHWINYAERFVRKERQVLPDEIWVSDEIAFSLAQSCFPEHSVRQLPNRYLEQLVEIINSSDRPVTDGQAHVLFVLEPIHESWGNNDTPGEFQALNFFISKLGLLGLGDNTKILLRPHPSDPVGKYDGWCATHSHLNISVDTTQTLPTLIAWADWVVGCETFAMVIALHVNKQILSALPPWAPPCKLPQKEIIMLRDL